MSAQPNEGHYELYRSLVDQVTSEFPDLGTLPPENVAKALREMQTDIKKDLLESGNDLPSLASEVGNIYGYLWILAAALEAIYARSD